MLVARSVYSKFHFFAHAGAPIKYKFPSGGTLLLEPKHSFTHCFWPAVEAYEPDVRAALHRLLKPGHVFVDCGANVGCWSVMAYGIVGKEGKVIAIEANPVTLALLQRNLDFNGMSGPVHCALTSKPGELELFVPSDGSDVYSSLRTGGLVAAKDAQIHKVQGRTLDEVLSSLHIERIDLIKIDIEGGEFDVMSSARATLEQKRPIVIVEYGTNTWPVFGVGARDLQALASSLNYTCNVFDTAEEAFRVANESDWNLPYANIILIPAEKVLTD
jgi:FkbM family methyltransferase